jgi:2-polyprenyl-3-methyl-5-hydroxy-6-metoxy-1,4-benzoquinol methylase
MSSAIDYSRYYSKWHNDTWDHALGQAKLLEPYLRLLALPEQPRVLDIGCGMGFFLLAARQAGWTDVLGIDLSPQQIAVARSHRLEVELVDDTLAWLGARVERFDAVVMLDVLEHIAVDQQIEAIRAVHRALKPGGTVLIRVPNASSSFAARYRWNDWTHCCSFTEHSIDFLLYNAGFHQIAVRDDHFGRWPLWVPRPNLQGLLRAFHFGIRRLQAIAEFGKREGSSMPLTLNLVAVARKEVSAPR